MPILHLQREKLYSKHTVRLLDQKAQEILNIPAYTLMQRAGEAAFAIAQLRFPHARQITVVCGAGANGGDGYVFARHALTMNKVQIFALANPAKLQGAARQAYEDLPKDHPHCTIHANFAPRALSESDLIVDAVLGTGVDRPIGEEWRQVIHHCNTQPAPTLSLDIPSGLDADTGQAWGDTMTAHTTMTFIALKQGLFQQQGPAKCGNLILAPLDIAADSLASAEGWTSLGEREVEVWQNTL